tara:strand:+ start:886 stop:2256 length:1371 start_codon:yes stop_codon:yes gene_type:complete
MFNRKSKENLQEAREYLKKLKALNEQNPEEDIDDDGTGGTYDPDMYSFNDDEWEFGDDVDWWDDDDYNINNPNSGSNYGQCDDYGCMDPQALNYNPVAGPYYYCELGCFYDNSDAFDDQWDQNLGIEQEECIIQGLNPCVVYDQGLGQPASVYCCHPQQQCLSPGGCIGFVQDEDDFGNNWDDITDDIVENFCVENPHLIGCRHSGYLNYCPSCSCDCEANFMGGSGPGTQMGNISCCSNINPDQIGSLGIDGRPITGNEACFTPESLITMENGEEKPISEIEIGDRVKSEYGISDVVGIDEHVGLYDVYSINGKKAFVTEEHPFKTIDGWKAINPIDTFRKHQVESFLLEEGDTLITVNGEEKIKSIEKTDTATRVFNLRLNNEHVYYTNGYLVHNGKDPVQELIVCPGEPGNPEITKLECERRTKARNQKQKEKERKDKDSKRVEIKKDIKPKR